MSLSLSLSPAWKQKPSVWFKKEKEKEIILNAVGQKKKRKEKDETKKESVLLCLALFLAGLFRFFCRLVWAWKLCDWITWNGSAKEGDSPFLFSSFGVSVCRRLSLEEKKTMQPPKKTQQKSNNNNNFSFVRQFLSVSPQE